MATAASTSPSEPLPHRLLRAAQPLEPGQPGQFILPLSSRDPILPGAAALVRARSQVYIPLVASRLLVAEPQKWRVASLRTGPRIGGRRIGGDHPGLSGPGPESTARLPSFPVDDEVDLAVEYVGPESSGECLVACLCAETATGSTCDGSRGSLDQVSTGPAAACLLAEARPVPRGRQVCLPLPPRAHDLHLSDLVLRVAEPTHWLVSDVLVGDDTLFVEDGDLPGELLADRPGRARLRLGRLRAGEDLVVQATYVGPLSSASLAYEVSGSEVPTRDVPGDSAFLSMSSGVPILGDAQVRSRVGLPRGYAFVPEEVVLRDPEQWVVRDVRIGNMSQLAQSGDVPGVVFGARTRGCRPSFAAVPGGGVDFFLDVKYVGTDDAGGRVTCGVAGRVVRLLAASRRQEAESPAR